MFENNNVSLDIVLQIGDIIHHDFSGTIKGIGGNLKMVSEPIPFYGKEENDPEYWKNKYLKLLEEHTELLRKTV